MILNFKDQLNKNDLLRGVVGLEREALRITPEGVIAQTDHPDVFGNRSVHPYITTDFAESQVEMITKPYDCYKEAHNELTLINQTVYKSINKELLWPYSMPPAFSWENVSIAKYPETDDGMSKSDYRKYLCSKYGNGVQLISGIHYNFSFSDSLLNKLYDVSPKKDSFSNFKNDLYMSIARNYKNYHWFFIYILGKTPNGIEVNEPNAASLRNSRYGYQNKVNLNLSYESLASYLDSVKREIEAGNIIDEREIYEPIRIKSVPGKTPLQALASNGISYLEFRSIDLNPLAFAGISLNDLKFVKLFILALFELPTELPIAIDELNNWTSLNGRAEIPTKIQSLIDKVIAIMEKIDLEFNLNLNTINDVLEESKIINSFDMLELAKKHKEDAIIKPYQAMGYEDMEMSTQLLITESIKRGVQVDVIDKAANFLRLTGQEKVEYVKQATKTSADTYISFLAMENKEVTKIILEDAGFPVPTGVTLKSVEEGLSYFDLFRNKEIVVKPKSTNFGLGIVMFRPLENYEDFKHALSIAFSFDSEVLVEKFLHGQEYRFLVVGDRCLSVLKRVGANVIGDGTSTIEELVAKKNEHPWRGVGHTSPLEKIVLGEIEIHNLKQAGYDPESVVEAGVQVFLRDNSNISTGGDSIEVFDQVHDFFKEQAVLAANAIGAKLCGVDLIINGDLSDASAGYGFIELNFNPAIHMHAFTYQGAGRNVTPEVLELLGLIGKLN